MSKPITEILYGTKATNNPPANVETDTVRILGTCGEKRAWFSIGTDELSTGVLCIGGTGSGKTTAIKSIVDQLKRSMSDRDVMVIFDTKGDYRDAFYRQDAGDCILGASSAVGERLESWNLFREVLADGYGRKAEMNIEEICRELFAPYVSAQQPFFANAARGIFAAYLLSTVRKAESDPLYASKNLNNYQLVRFFRHGMANIRALADSYEDLLYVKSYLGKGESDQALGILAELHVMLNDCFVGSFAGSGSFSMREFIRARGGRTLFIEYDPTVGSVLGPIYSLLIDLALKEALGRMDQEDRGNVYVILDEFKLVPSVSHIDDAVNFGRSQGIKLIAGMQAISQIYDVYGEEKARSLAAGFGSMLAFRPNDAKTRDFVSEYFGRTITAEITIVNQRPESQRREGHTVEDWELRELMKGEAFISVAGRQPYRYRFPLFKKA